MENSTLLHRKLIREKEARLQAEDLLESKSRELYYVNRELQQMNQQLEELVKIRTSELEKSRDEAVSASEAKSQFLANMSHEIRTPLHGILGLMDLIKQEKLSDQQSECIDVVQQSGDLLLSIINDILDFSRIEAGKMNYEMKSFDLRKCIEGVCIPLSQQTTAKKINFLCYIDQDLPIHMTSDETRFRQILMNLVGNAIKFTPRGEIFIHAKKRVDKISISIRDTGVGIPKQKIDQIFKPFSQSDVSDTRLYGGSGLGLSISKKLIDGLKGTLSVESVETKGSCFTFEIPMNQVSEAPLKQEYMDPRKIILLSSSESTKVFMESYFKSYRIKTSTDYVGLEMPNDCILIYDHLTGAPIQKELHEWIELNRKTKRIEVFVLADLLSRKNITETTAYKVVMKPLLQKELSAYFFKNTVAQSAEVKDTKVHIRKSEKILLVEDNPVNVKIASLILKNLNIEFTVAENGLEAVKAFQEGYYSLILMDCQMPIMDGYQATQKIRELGPQGKNVKIVALTANAFRATQEKCYESGMDEFLTKPFTIEELKKIIQSWRESEK